MKNNNSVRIRLLLWLGTWIIISVASLIQNFTELGKNGIVVPVRQINFAKQFYHADSLRSDINNYKYATIKSSPVILIERPGILLKLLAPYAEPFPFDPLFSLLTIIISLTAMLFLWNSNFNQLFVGNFSKTFFWAAIFCLSFWLINLLRLYWFNNQVRHLTNDQYTYKFIYKFDHIEVWFGVLFGLLSFIIKKGESLQKEQELTV